MKTLGVISCTKSKLDYPCDAYKMYSKSTLFRYLYSYCCLKYSRVIILSAKYGLLEPLTRIEPYEKTLLKMTRLEIIEWSAKVRNQLVTCPTPREDYVWHFHMGKVYLNNFPFQSLTDLGINFIKHYFPGGIGTTMGHYKKEVEHLRSQEQFTHGG